MYLVLAMKKLKNFSFGAKTTITHSTLPPAQNIGFSCPVVSTPDRVFVSSYMQMFRCKAPIVDLLYTGVIITNTICVFGYSTTATR